MKKEKIIKDSKDGHKNKVGKNKKETIEGKIFINKKGVGYVSSENLDEDLEISPHNLNTALPQDKVKVSIKKNSNKKRKQGKVEEVVERFKENFVGEIEKINNKYFVLPDNKKIHIKFRLNSEDPKKVNEDSKVLVKLVGWKDPKKNPKGKIVKVIGKKGEHEVEMKSLVFEHGFDISFPKNVEKEAEEINKNKEIREDEISKRKDFRKNVTFTIDPEDAKDFDDAISIKKLEKEAYEIGIHIADVSHYVKKGTAIEKEALDRATSIYLVDRTIPMLPNVLSENICSLKPDEERLAFSAVFKIDKSGNVKTRWFGRAIIKSNKRFSYEKAQDVLDKKNGEFFEELSALNSIAKKLRKRRMDMGSIAFGSEEVGFELNEDGFPRHVYTKEAKDTNKLIEEFMLLANREIAEEMQKFCQKNSKASFIYRVHKKPNPEKIEELAIFVRALGYDFNTRDGKIKPKELNKLFEKIEGSSKEELIKTAAIRAMSKAEYSTKNIGHFGLSFSRYTHFTSPIRRYPDLCVHRIVKKKIDKKPFTNNEKLDLDFAAKHSSEKELEAISAERDSIEYKQIEYMNERIGEEFNGIISGIVEYGIYITEEKSKANGLIHVSKLNGDYYKLDKKNYRLIGEKTNKEYSLGDKVKVKLTKVNLEEKEMDFEILE